MAVIEHLKRDREVNKGDKVTVTFSRAEVGRLHITREADFRHWLNIDLSEAEVLKLLREMLNTPGIL